ncbi:MAG: cytochrome C [Chitinophagaceae bacterium BSSC1]|nr:MAG: cytochrome C [Chitinophagaceae bacterium BSSC1]
MIVLALLFVMTILKKGFIKTSQTNIGVLSKDSLWSGKTPDLLPNDTSSHSALIRYGYELIAHTSKYLGPNGQVKRITNGMNCQNCHLQAGAKAWGLNYGSVAANYPKFRARSGTFESIYKRINDCLERSLNGHGLDSNSSEMQAFASYILWLGADIPKGTIAKGSGINNLAFLNRAANPDIGKALYNTNCSKCHGNNGEGMRDSSENGNYFLNPPLWGKSSYNHGAGINQLSKLAGFIKNNMPNGINYQQPFLTNQEAWDLAAYINTQARPNKDLSKDWPSLATKPFDYPYGPYADSFPQSMHQLGPFAPIQTYWKNKTNSK